MQHTISVQLCFSHLSTGVRFDRLLYHDRQSKNITLVILCASIEIVHSRRKSLLHKICKCVDITKVWKLHNIPFKLDVL